MNKCATWLLCVTAILAFPAPLHAQDCPTAKHGAQGFIVERGDKQKSEVFHVGDGLVRTVMRYGGTTQLETTLYEGLLSLERIDRGRKLVRKPLADLAALFPLKAGSRVSARFELTTPNELVLSVKSAEQIFIGRCKYRVLKIEESEARGEHPLATIATDYYSPELKLVLMREYQDGGGRSTVIKYDKIYPIK